MHKSILRSLARFFEGTGSVLSTPSGDARGHLNVPIDTMYDIAEGHRFMGR